MTGIVSSSLARLTQVALAGQMFALCLLWQIQMRQMWPPPSSNIPCLMAMRNTLSIAPEGKFPVRLGPVAGSTEYIDLWSTLDVGVDRRAPLADLYPADVIASIASGLESPSRWGVAEGQLACLHHQ